MGLLDPLSFMAGLITGSVMLGLFMLAIVALSKFINK